MKKREREYPVLSVCLQCLQRALFIFSYFFSSVSSFACLPSSAAAEHISSPLFSPSLPLPPLLQQRLCSVSPLLYPLSLSLFAQTQPTEQRVCSVCNCLNSLQQQQSFPGEYSPSSLSLSLSLLGASAPESGLLSSSSFLSGCSALHTQHSLPASSSSSVSYPLLAPRRPPPAPSLPRHQNTVVQAAAFSSSSCGTVLPCSFPPSPSLHHHSTLRIGRHCWIPSWLPPPSRCWSEIDLKSHVARKVSLSLDQNYCTFGALRREPFLLLLLDLPLHPPPPPAALPAKHISPPSRSHSQRYTYCCVVHGESTERVVYSRAPNRSTSTSFFSLFQSLALSSTSCLLQQHRQQQQQQQQSSTPPQ